MNSKLAELCGIIVGDGHLSKYISKSRTDYKISIIGHRKDDKKYFLEVKKLFKKTINVTPKLKIKDNYCQLVINSKKTLEFFVNLGIPIGKKADKVNILEVIKNNLQLSCDFLRGLADTDFSLVLRSRKKKEKYPRITADLKSIKLINEVCKILSKLGINYCGPYQRNRFRNNTPFTTYEIDINGHKNLELWMDKISFRNPKHLNKIKKIREG